LGAGDDKLVFTPQPGFTPPDEAAEIQWLGGDTSNSAVVIGRSVMLKVFRRIVDGIHPEEEMVKELTRRGFTGIAPLLGEATHVRSDGGAATVMVAQRFIENQGDGFHWSVEQAKRLLDDRTSVEEGHDGFETVAHFVCVAGQRLGEMHRELGQPSDNPDFAPEPATENVIATWRETARRQVGVALDLLDGRDLGNDTEAVRALLERRDALMTGIDTAMGDGFGSQLIRIHGDLHLGQVLVAAGDAVIVDFEGEPLKPISERRAKNSAMRDVAGMLRSFSYVVWTALRTSPTTAQIDVDTLLTNFETRSAAAFTEGYVRGRGSALTPKEERLLRVFSLERAAYEVGYEIANRPDQIAVPLAGFLNLASSISQA
jgi:maltose alpha-D-glucosyltransferase/alpha-amylase